MQDIGKSFYSFYYDPWRLSASESDLWDLTNKGCYFKVFGINEEREDVVSDEKFYQLFGTHFLFRYIKDFFKNKSKDEHPSQLFKFHILYFLSNLLKRLNNSESINYFLKEIVKNGLYICPDVDRNKELELKKLIKEISKIVDIEIRRRQRNENEETFVIRNFQRKEKSIKDLDLTINDHIDDELIINL